MSKATVCDYCDDKIVKKWSFAITSVINNCNGEGPTDPLPYNLDFCDMRCLKCWAEEKAK